jgi:hypothetical protein
LRRFWNHYIYYQYDESSTSDNIDDRNIIYYGGDYPDYNDEYIYHHHFRSRNFNAGHDYHHDNNQYYPGHHNYLDCHHDAGSIYPYCYVI